MEVDASSSYSDSSDKVHISQTQTQKTSHLDPSPAAGEGRDLSLTRENAAETERQLSERVAELEGEVCSRV